MVDVTGGFKGDGFFQQGVGGALMGGALVGGVGLVSRAQIELSPGGFDVKNAGLFVLLADHDRSSRIRRRSLREGWIRARQGGSNCPRRHRDCPTTGGSRRGGHGATSA